MKIQRITVWHLELPLVKPYWLSGGRLRFDQLDSTFVRLETTCGLEGWGEACPWGHTYLPAHGPGVRAGIETLAPAILGRDPRSVENINRAMDVQLPGHPFAKSPIDMACWDILGKATGLPLWQLFGAESPAPVALNSSIPTGLPQDMVASIEAAHAAGYRVHSAKIGGTDPSADIARLDAIAAALPTGDAITFDVNRAWTPGVAIEVLNSTRARGWIEQPCETLAQCGHVARRVPQPIMLDECLHTFADHLTAFESRCGEGAKIKPNRLGGLTRARQARDFGVAIGWQMHIEDVGGSAVADTAAFHLAASTPDENRLASWLAHAHLRDDPVGGQGVRNSEGIANLPTIPGIGVTPEASSLGKPTAVYEAKGTVR